MTKQHPTSSSSEQSTENNTRPSNHDEVEQAKSLDFSESQAAKKERVTPSRMHGFQCGTLGTRKNLPKLNPFLESELFSFPPDSEDEFHIDSTGLVTRIKR